MFVSTISHINDLVERYQHDAAIIWSTEAECECGECETPAAALEQRQLDADLRLREFAQELRRP